MRDAHSAGRSVGNAGTVRHGDLGTVGALSSHLRDGASGNDSLTGAPPSMVAAAARQQGLERWAVGGGRSGRRATRRLRSGVYSLLFGIIFTATVAPGPPFGMASYAVPNVPSPSFLPSL